MNAPQLESHLAIGRPPLAAILASAPISERGGEDPGPTGPEGERVGDRDEADEPVPSTQKDKKDLDPIPGPGAPMVPDHASIDANPIDPRVF